MSQAGARPFKLRGNRVNDKLMPDGQTFVLPCARCGVAPQSSAARFCRRCGAVLPVEHVYEHRLTGWKSLPILIRLAIWIVAVPVLIAGAVWALVILAVISR
jgi:hypothetical protein